MKTILNRLLGGSLKNSPTDKITCAGTVDQQDGDDVSFAVSSMQGRRKTQEDTCAIETELRANDAAEGIYHDVLPGHALFAVFDGHGTGFASEYAATHFVSTLCRQPHFVMYSKKFLADIPKPHRENFTGKKKGKATRRKIEQSHAFDYGAEGETAELRMLLEDAIKRTMIELDANMLRDMTARRNQHVKKRSNASSLIEHENLYDEFDSGTTAIIVILTPQFIVCANLGDSRAILQRGAAEPSITTLSNDHKPNNKNEALRIHNAGGVIISGAVGGRLAVSRGLGDFAFKHTASVLCALDRAKSEIDDYVHTENQIVTSVPEISVLERQVHDKFILIACDGIWDVLSNENCAKLVSTIFFEGERSVSLVCEEVLDQCYAKGSLDNMTAVLIKFSSQDVGLGGGVMKRRQQRIRKG
ncbi:hypothetical protein ACHAW5_001399 [Stephanodiscus triporus]|uniref:PPM-type phosphatase domain-containing protein n=1 Tax=Stephanodiscus triporus TaxID=2934178 RepID=A0ABD3MBV5_9STRA